MEKLTKPRPFVRQSDTVPSTVQKIDMAMKDAGLLHHEQVDRFIQQLLDTPTILHIYEVPKPTLWTRFKWKVTAARERLGELIAGRNFSND